jgi:hypothetical protein
VVVVVAAVNVAYRFFFQKMNRCDCGFTKKATNFAVEKPKSRGQLATTAKHTPGIRHLTLGFTVFMDHVSAKAKPGPISALNEIHSRMATSV